MKTKIDITMTATLRPSLIQKTLKSYWKNLFSEFKDDFDYSFIINIDPVGENIKPKEIIKFSNTIFENVIYNIPDKPSFPKAVKWTWNQCNGDFVFHLEDDWLLDRYVNLRKLVNILNKYDDLACLRFCKYNIPKKETTSFFKSKYFYNPDGFYIAEDSKSQFGLNPCLIKIDFVREARNYMIDDINPEKQFRYSNSLMRKLIMKWKYGIFGNPGDKILAIDNGVNWKFDNKFKKPDEKTFLVWEKI